MNPRHAVATIALLTLGLDAQEPATARGEWDARLQLLCEELDARRAQLHVPGMALAIVRGDEVVVARGFGWRDVERRSPATENTVFAIGSTTKTFTAMLLGMLAEEGKLDYDEPVSAYLPGFALADRRAATRLTLRDLLTHRTGLSRMPMTWCAGEVDRVAALRCMQEAELLGRFRGDFNYSNMNYLAAGVAAARVAGKSWDELVAERLLRPLGMATASTSIEALRDPSRASRGYRWDECDRAFQRLRLFDLRTIAPAGAINASVVDMSSYLRMLLAGGIAPDGVRLVQRETLEELWEPQVLIDVQRHYGLGWMVGEWRDRRVVDHGGNVDGFCSTFALLPEERLGFSLLMNVKDTALRREAPELVWEALLGELTPPNRMAEAELSGFVGSFRGEESERRLETRVRLGRLQTRLGDEPWRELQWPDERGLWRRADRETFSIEFEKGDDGRIDALTLRRRRGKEEPMQRVEVAADEPTQPFAPEVRKLLDRMRAAVGADAAVDLAFRLEGTVGLTHQGLTGRAAFLGSGPERYAERHDYGDFGYEDTGFDGVSPWGDSSMSAFTELEGGRRELTGLTDAVFFVDWSLLFREVELQRRRTMRGRATDVLRITPRELPPFVVYVDAETAHMVRIKLTLPMEELGIHVPVTIELGDYRPVGPVRLPFHRVFTTPILGERVVQFERATVDVEVTDAAFVPR